MNKVFYYLKLALITLPCLLLTLFIGVSSFEVAFNKDLPYIGAVETFSSSALVENLVSQAATSSASKNKEVVSIQALKFPLLSHKLGLIPALKQENKFVERSNKGQFIVVTQNSESGVGNMIVYLRKSWRTVDNPELLKEGSKFYLETDSYNNMYKVVEIKNKSLGSNFLLDNLPRSYVLLVIEDPKENVNYFIKAVFVSQEKFS